MTTQEHILRTADMLTEDGEEITVCALRFGRHARPAVRVEVNRPNAGFFFQQELSIDDARELAALLLRGVDAVNDVLLGLWPKIGRDF